MKRILKITTLCLLFVSHCGYSVKAQTTSTPAGSLFSDVTGTFLTASNWMVAPYGIYDLTTHKAGIGVGLIYNVNTYVGAFTRLDYINKELWRPSGGAQLQLPVTLGKVVVVPFVFDGIAVPFSGASSGNGEVQNIAGMGLAVRVTKHLDIITDWEYWSHSQQLRLGVLWKF